MNKQSINKPVNSYLDELKRYWDDVCDLYLKRFCDKHEFELDPDPWVSGDKGTVAMIGDMFVGMDDIRYDIDNRIDEGKFWTWYWKNLEVYELTGMNYMNYPSFCKGAPDEWTEERMEKLREMHKHVMEAQQALDEEIESYKKIKKLF